MFAAAARAALIVNNGALIVPSKLSLPFLATYNTLALVGKCVTPVWNVPAVTFPPTFKLPVVTRYCDITLTFAVSSVTAVLP